MAKLPILSAKELCSFLEKQGFVFDRQKGSHRIFNHCDGRTVIIPIHGNKSIGRGLLKTILDEIDMSRDEFMEKQNGRRK